MILNTPSPKSVGTGDGGRFPRTSRHGVFVPFRVEPVAVSEELFLALNAVYLRKMGSVEAICECSGLERGTVQTLLGQAVGDGLAIDLGTEFVLDDLGRRAVLQFYDVAYGHLRTGGKVIEWYGQFEALNAQFLKLISEWQTSGGKRRVLAYLLRVVERHIAAIHRIEDTIPRYRTYASRFTVAMDRIDLGDLTFVTNPRADSIHNVWFEFQEDILAVVGKPRDTGGLK